MKIFPKSRKTHACEIENTHPRARRAPRESARRGTRRSARRGGVEDPGQRTAISTRHRLPEFSTKGLVIESPRRVFERPRRSGARMPDTSRNLRHQTEQPPDGYNPRLHASDTGADPTARR